MPTFLALLALIVYVTVQEVATFRLSRNVIPRHYSLKLHPNIDGDDFQGEVSIKIFSELEEESFILHSQGLNITNVTVDLQPVVIQEETEQRISLCLKDKKCFQPGEHILRLVFNGTYQEKIGLRKAKKYNSDEGFIIVNESEPCYARMIFPCFDEPYFKARFSVRLITPNETYRALSNMPEIARYPTKSGIAFDFETSVEMSTYLLSVVITDYPYYEEMLTVGNKTIPLRVYTSNASKENNDAAIQATKFYMDYFTQYTGIEYSLPKLDLIEYDKKISIATETWGLVQFSEDFLSFNKDSSRYGFRILSIAHELSHFWFGNLVTVDWWDDLWIQEGYASLISQESTSRRNLTVDISLTDVIMVENKSHLNQLVIPLMNTQHTEERFNFLVYRKGGYLLKSLKSLIGEEMFQETTKQFLQKHIFKTVTSNDLISAFEVKVPNINVRSFLESYLYQKGCPVIKVDDTVARQYTLMQVHESLEISKWTIPISYRFGNGTTGLIWFDRDLENVVLENRNQTDWIIVNTVEKPGLYIVNYTEKMWLNLVRNIDAVPVHELTKLGENFNLLYSSKYIKCDLIFKTIMNSKMLDWIGSVIEELLINITCFPLQYETLKGLIKGRFGSYKYDESDYSFLCPPHDELKIADSNIKYCLRWIDQNVVNKTK